MPIKDTTIRRSKRTRFKLKKKGNLRLSVFRSNKFLYAQLIDDGLSKTLVSSASIQKQFKDVKCSPKEMAFKIGEDIGSKILKKKIEKKFVWTEGDIFFMEESKNLH